MGARVNRPHWGGYRVLAEGEGFRVKLLEFEGGAIRKQAHAYRDEAWVCVEGRIAGDVDGERHEMEPGDSLFIEAGQWHQLGGYGKVLEVWLGQNLTEKDIELDDE